MNECLGVPVRYDAKLSSIAPTVYPSRRWFPWRIERVPGICQSRGIWRWKEIVVGEAFNRFSSREQMAILMHEVAHVKLRHAEARLRSMWMIFLKPYAFAALCVNQEFQADQFVINLGYGSELASVLSRLGNSIGSLHPDSVRRIARLLACSKV